MPEYLKRCMSCGAVINAGRTFCSQKCYDNATFKYMLVNRQRKEYMIEFEMRREEINLNENEL